MISVKKLATLKSRVQLRKIGNIFHEHFLYENEYLEAVFSFLLTNELLTDEDKAKLSYFYNSRNSLYGDDIYFYLLDKLGESVADWDFKDEEGAILWEKRKLLNHYLYLDHLRSPYNVGSIFRSAESFCVSSIYLSPGSASPEHPRAIRTSRDTVYGVDWSYKELEEIDKPIFALELGGVDIADFSFPRDAICIVGSEESGVSKEALALADKSLGRVSIAQYGAKGSINVSAATSILLYEWMKSELDS